MFGKKWYSSDLKKIYEDCREIKDHWLKVLLEGINRNKTAAGNYAPLKPDCEAVLIILQKFRRILSEHITHIRAMHRSFPSLDTKAKIDNAIRLIGEIDSFIQNNTIRPCEAIVAMSGKPVNDASVLKLIGTIKKNVGTIRSFVKELDNLLSRA